MSGSGEWVCSDVVVRVSEQVGSEEDESGEEEEESDDGERVFSGEEGVESDGILRRFDFDSCWVIGTGDVHGNDMEYDDGEDDEG